MAEPSTPPEQGSKLSEIVLYFDNKRQGKIALPASLESLGFSVATLQQMLSTEITAHVASEMGPAAKLRGLYNSSKNGASVNIMLLAAALLKPDLSAVQNLGQLRGDKLCIWAEVEASNRPESTGEYNSNHVAAQVLGASTFPAYPCRADNRQQQG